MSDEPEYQGDDETPPAVDATEGDAQQATKAAETADPEVAAETAAPEVNEVEKVKKELASYKSAIDSLKADPRFNAWYDQTYNGKEEAKKIELADDDLITFKDAKAFVQQAMQDGLKSERAFIDQLRQREADRERDELLREFPDARDYATKMQAIQENAPNLTIKQLYLLAAHDDLKFEKVKKTEERRDKAGKFVRPAGAGSKAPGAPKSLEEELGILYDAHHAKERKA